jgi:hypothetical protein
MPEAEPRMRQPDGQDSINLLNVNGLTNASDFPLQGAGSRTPSLKFKASRRKFENLSEKVNYISWLTLQITKAEDTVV